MLETELSDYDSFIERVFVPQSIKFVNAFKNHNPNLEHLVKKYYTECKSFNFTQCGSKEAIEAINIIGKENNQVEELEFGGSKWLNDAVIIPIVKNNHLLRKIYLSGCVGLTPKSLLQASRHCCNLTHISLANCGCWVTPSFFSKLIKNSKFIQEVDVSGCPLIDDSCLQAIAIHCNFHLEKIILQNPPKCTSKGFDCLAKKAKIYKWIIT